MTVTYTNSRLRKISAIYVFKIILFFVVFVCSLLIFSIIGKNIYINNFYKAPVSFPLQSILKINGMGNSETVNIKQVKTVIIDAGHGGEDGGAVSAEGFLEKDINLKISQYLEDYLTLSDISVAMTRTEDVLLYNENEKDRKKYYDLQNRIKIANEFDDAIFISIHQNKFPIPKYSGLQVYYSKNNPESKTVAQIIQDNTVRLIQKENNRKIKEAGREIRVLDTLTMPAVLVECGFLSNEKEAKLLSTDEYQKKIAFVIFLSVMEYINS